MDRRLKFDDLQKTVVDAYENFKSIKDGQVDERLAGVDDKLFGITVVLTDGRTIHKGDTDVKSPLGRIANLPTHVLLLQQNSADELVRKSGACRCHGKKTEKPHIGLSPHGIRAVSAVVPQNDADGKWDILINNLINMAGSAPVLDDKLYELRKKELEAKGAIDQIAQAEYSLYDDASIAVDLYTRLESLDVTTGQAARIGATIAADGRNPENGQEVFDGSIAANLVALAARGPHHEGKAWMMAVGLPAVSSFGGLVLAILPGFGAIAAYSPLLDCNGVSTKAAKAIKYIANTLQLNIYASARVDVEK